MYWNVDNEARIEPPIHALHLRSPSGTAQTRIIFSDANNLGNSFRIRSSTPTVLDVP